MNRAKFLVAAIKMFLHTKSSRFNFTQTQLLLLVINHRKWMNYIVWPHSDGWRNYISFPSIDNTKPSTTTLPFLWFGLKSNISVSITCVCVLFIGSDLTVWAVLVPLDVFLWKALLLVFSDYLKCIHQV